MDGWGDGLRLSRGKETVNDEVKSVSPIFIYKKYFYVVVPSAAINALLRIMYEHFREHHPTGEKLN